MKAEIDGKGVCRLRFAFGEEARDLNGHVNNIEYVRKMQDAAEAHVNAAGWPMERLLGVGKSWVVRWHRIEYMRSCAIGEPVVLCTWVRDYRRIRSLRRYRFLRESDGTVLAEAETEWVFLDVESKRPARIPEAFMEIFPAIPEEEEERIGCAAAVPPRSDE